jgi:hypothetical protein
MVGDATGPINPPISDVYVGNSNNRRFGKVAPPPQGYNTTFI